MLRVWGFWLSIEGHKKRIRLLVAYDGTDFCGWQRQSQGGKISVALALEQALEKVLNEPIRLCASGRTDAGVHAHGQVCHFDTSHYEMRAKKWDLCWALNAQLPSSIVVKRAWLAPEDFHATLSADRKTYRYVILNHPRPSPFLHRYASWSRKPIDLKHLQESSQYLLGEHDFKSMQSAGSVVAHTRRIIYQAKWEKEGSQLRFSVTGNGFLKQMVRNIVGTQLLLEQKDLAPVMMKEILAAQDRQRAGPPAPAQGLFLMKVYYPQNLDKRCIEI